MSVTALRGHPPTRFTRGATPWWRTGGSGNAAAPFSRPREALRLVAFAAVLVVCVVRWSSLLLIAPSTWRGVGFALGCAVVAALLVFVGSRLERWLRFAITAAVAVLGVGAALLTAGAPLWLLDPHDWDTLTTFIGDGVSALPGVTVPYRGLDEWVRIVIGLGALLLAGAATLAVAWPRRGGRSGSLPWTLVFVAVLFAVPAVQRSGAHPWVSGALFALPVCVLVLADRLPRRLAWPAGALVVATVLLAMAIAPSFDADDPLIDVQAITESLQPDTPDVFDWSHGYGPLDWPRDGRELLRIKTNRPAYWKAEDLELFDGRAWRTQFAANPRLPIAEGLREHPDWKREVRVTIKNLSTRDFIAPGEVLSISRAPRQPVNTRPGGFTVPANKDPLGSGDAYVAESYVPQPTKAELEASPAAYPNWLADDMAMLAPPDGTAGRVLLHFLPFGTVSGPIASGSGVAPFEGVDVLDRSGYGGVYALSQRLASGARTPYEFAKRVEDYLGKAPFVYDEKVRDQRLPLVAFLMDTHAGYCQHFSGAMALLLRMGGVPARVVSGFAPGQLDAGRKEYVARDLDAHSWVEVWFAGIGWVTFDPTPAEAPARSQDAGGALLDTGSVPGGPQPHGSIGGADVGPGGEAAALPSAPGGGSALPEILIGLCALAALGAGGWALWRRRAGWTDRDGEGGEVAELERALRRTGRPVPPGTTLLAIEQRFAYSPGARAYIRALVDRRYGDGGEGPSAADRRALRRSLGDGLGPLGRLRALWALPPRGLH